METLPGECTPLQKKIQPSEERKIKNSDPERSFQNADPKKYPQESEHPEPKWYPNRGSDFNFQIWHFVTSLQPQPIKIQEIGSSRSRKL